MQNKQASKHELLRDAKKLPATLIHECSEPGVSMQQAICSLLHLACHVTMQQAIFVHSCSLVSLDYPERKERLLVV